MSAPVSRAVPAASRRPSSIASLLFALVCAGLFALEVHVVFVRETGVPSADRGVGARLVGNVGAERAVTQTFRVDAGGFNGFTFEAAPFEDRPVSGTAVLSIAELDQDGQRELIVERTVPAQDLAATTAYRFDFPPIESSKGLRYEFRLSVPDLPAGHGLGVWMTRDQAYLGGAASFAGREQWGDLAFRVHATRGTVFRRLEEILSDQPLFVRSRVVLGAMFFAYNWALAVFGWYLFFAPDEFLARPA
ncbi:MAG: hypothetical protein AB7I50_09640 [Vicinamibacterales bacterium]